MSGESGKCQGISYSEFFDIPVKHELFIIAFVIVTLRGGGGVESSSQQDH